MSRSGYTDDPENGWLYRGAVDRAIAGKRGQAALGHLLAALDGMPTKELISASFSTGCGVCALGALAAFLGIDMADLEKDPDDWDNDVVDSKEVGRRLDIARSMAAEIMYENDEGAYVVETSAERWIRVRAWVHENLIKVAS